MTWFETFDAVFFITITTILTGSIGLALKFCLRSKCQDFNICWGCVSINRRVDIEGDEEITRMELGIPESPNIGQQSINI